MIAVGVAAIGVAITVQALSANSAPKLSQPEADAIYQALSKVPESDVAGNDIDGIPRPASSVRSFYRVSGRVTAVIYSRSGAYDEVKTEVQSRLPESGWTATANVPQGGAPTAGPSWVRIYNKGATFLQVFVLSSRNVTATYYIYQQPS